MIRIAHKTAKKATNHTCTNKIEGQTQENEKSLLSRCQKTIELNRVQIESLSQKKQDPNRSNRRVLARRDGFMDKIWVLAHGGGSRLSGGS